MTTVEKLEKTLRTARAFISRTHYVTLTKRALEIADRYDDLRSDLLGDDGYNAEWRAYCTRHGFDLSHKGVDLFC